MLKNFLLTLSLVVSAPLAFADASLEYVDAGTGTMQTRIAVARDKLRIDAAGSGGSYVVLDLATQTLTQINPQRRTTTSSTVEEVTRIVSSLSSASDPASQPLLQFALGSLPPEQRGQLQRMLEQSRQDAQFPYRRSGVLERVAGIPCEVYTQRSPTGDARSLCAAGYDELGLADGDVRTLQTAMELLRRTGGPWLRAAQVPGLPLRYAGSFDRGAFSGAGHLKSISQLSLPATHFSDPPGFRIVSILEMLASAAPAR